MRDQGRKGHYQKPGAGAGCARSWDMERHRESWNHVGNTITAGVTIRHSAAASLQSCPTLCDPMDCSPPGSPLPGILQARTLEWVAISFSNA